MRTRVASLKSGSGTLQTKAGTEPNSAGGSNADIGPINRCSNRYGWQSQFSVVAGPGFGPIFGLLAGIGNAFGIGGFEPPQPISDDLP
jgi:hypothetical protein